MIQTITNEEILTALERGRGVSILLVILNFRKLFGINILRISKSVLPDMKNPFPKHLTRMMSLPNTNMY